MARIKTRIVMEELRSGEVLYFLEKKETLLKKIWNDIDHFHKGCEGSECTLFLILCLIALCFTPILLFIYKWHRIDLTETTLEACKSLQKKILQGDPKEVKRKIVLKSSVKKSV